MSLSHLLDTSVYCQPIKPKPLSGIEAHWRALGDDALATSVICKAEILFGIELHQSTRLRAVYNELLADRLQVLPVDEVVARAFSLVKANCRKKGFAASDFDFLIAATAMVHKLILVTLNRRHFSGIDGLAVEDWSS